MVNICDYLGTIMLIWMSQWYVIYLFPLLIKSLIACLQNGYEESSPYYKPSETNQDYIPPASSCSPSDIETTLPCPETPHHHHQRSFNRHPPLKTPIHILDSNNKNDMPNFLQTPRHNNNAPAPPDITIQPATPANPFSHTNSDSDSMLISPLSTSTSTSPPLTAFSSSSSSSTNTSTSTTSTASITTTTIGTADSTSSNLTNMRFHGGSRKKQLSMGPRADCEKCRLKVPGHWMHFD